MRITRLTAENIKRLRVVSIDVSGNVVVVGGRNGQGKSSTLDSIAYALGGQKLCPEVPIRRGAKRAKAEVVLSNGMVITRKFKATGSTLTVTAADGMKARSPQKLLDALVGALTFDPLAFSTMTSVTQAETLRRLVGLDTSDLDGTRQRVFDERTVMNRELKRATAHRESLPLHEGVGDLLIVVSEIVAEIRRREGVNRSNEDRREDLEDKRRVAREAYESLDDAQTEVRALALKLIEAKDEVKRLRDDLAKKGEEAKALAAEVADLKDFPADDVEEKLAVAEETNRKVRENLAHAEARKSEQGLAAAAEKFTDALEEIAAEKVALIAATKFPVNGLSVTDEGVLLNELPFEQASSAEQLRCSVAIALALNPKLRVMLIRNGSLLDSDGMALVAQMAEAAEAQVWIERVGEGDDVSIVIEDGEVKSQQDPGVG